MTKLARHRLMGSSKRKSRSFLVAKLGRFPFGNIVADCAFGSLSNGAELSAVNILMATCAGFRSGTIDYVSDSCSKILRPMTLCASDYTVCS